MDTKEIWCMLEPCLTNREGQRPDHGARAYDAGEFRTHLVEAHDFGIDDAMWLDKTLSQHSDGLTHTWEHYRILAQSRQVGYVNYRPLKETACSYEGSPLLHSSKADTRLALPESHGAT